MGEAFLTIECAFALTARVRIGDKTTVPPIGADIIEKMMHDAVAKGCGNDFANHWVAYDESHTAAGFVIAAHNAVAQVDSIFHGIELVAVFVHGMAFAFARSVIGYPKFA